jgi:hypothetical protein
MSKFVVMTRCHDYYYKLPDGIETLEDEKVEKYVLKYGDLFLKLKDNDEWFTIQPTYSDDEGFFTDKNKEYLEEKDTPFYESEEEEN